MIHISVVKLSLLFSLSYFITLYTFEQKITHLYSSDI